MPKSVTVEFENGTSHTYDNVPDNIDDETVRDRAANEFSDKKVAGVTAGAKAEETGPGLGTQIVGGAQTAFNYAKAPIEFAMEHPIATGVGVSLLPEAITNKIPIINQAAQYGRGALQKLSGVTPVSPAAQQTFNALKTPPPAEVAPAAESLMNKIGSKFAPLAQRVAPALRGAGTALNNVAPAAMLAAPYQMAGYEQEKIRANPTAPQYQNNPYGQMYRQEAPTQGAAGAMNRRSAIGSQQYGGVNAQEQAVLKQDRLNQMIREAAAKKALAQSALTPGQ